MKINPTAIVFWLFCGMMGFLIGGTVHTAILGAAIAIGVSLLATIFL